VKLFSPESTGTRHCSADTDMAATFSGQQPIGHAAFQVYIGPRRH